MINKTNKVIGIPGYAKGDDFFGVGMTYIKFASRFANVRIIMPWEQFVKVDLLLLPGGMDVNPSAYGEIPEYGTGNTDVLKQYFLDAKLDNYLSNTKVLGICLGAQQLAVKYGGVLTQNLIYHAQSDSRWSTAHEVYEVELEGDDYKIKPKTKFKVNSHHHQALCMKGLSALIEPLIMADNEDHFLFGEGDIIEAFKIKDEEIYGVQWHPEELYDAFTIGLINKLLM